MKSINQILKWIQDYWGALLIVWGLIGGALSFVHFNIVMPMIDEHIDSRVYKVAKDSLEPWTEHHLLNRPNGFRGEVMSITLIPKKDVADTVASIIMNEDDIKKQLKENTQYVNYLMKWSNMVLKQIATSYVYKDVEIWVTSAGDELYLDNLGMVWDANFVASDDCYYYYPSYAKGIRLKCRKKES